MSEPDFLYIRSAGIISAHLNNQIAGYTPEFFRISDFQCQLVLVILHQFIRTCRMSSQQLCTFGVQLDFLVCTDINTSPFFRIF